MDSAELADLGQQLRVDGIRASAAAGSGHPTSSMSAADLMAVLLAHHLHYDFDRPEHPADDRFVLSKGHASPLLYAAYKAAGAIDDDELLTFRTLGSRLEEFPVGGSKVLRSSGQGDRVTIVAAGVTVPEALAAADALDAQGIPVRVVDLYSVKPVDRDTLRRAAEDTGCLLTVEDHHPEGGLGDAVLDAFLDGRPVPRLVRLAVTSMPGSASPEEQLHAAGIDAESIAAAVRLLVEQAVTP
ncbi:transketolase C-terminal domain-containing protein [Streptomyces longwoodensis]|uniref:transketolase C-terminal domain-containing protein n=1 Tax=Streptomyces longwoodensis TaxID=68231 RepID=UPI0033E7FD1F